MSLHYNGEILEPPIEIPMVPGLGHIALDSSIEITYLTAVHVAKKDFDQKWIKDVQAADAVFHEEYSAHPQAVQVLNAIAQGVAPPKVYTPDRDKYGFQRMSAIHRTKKPQFIWDVSRPEAEALGLPQNMENYKSHVVHAEGLMRAGNFDEAIEAMQQAEKMLAFHSQVRGIRGVEHIAETLVQNDKVKSVVVFAGASHIYQAILLAKLAPENEIKVKSLLTDPFGISVTSYLRAIAGTSDTDTTARGMLYSAKYDQILQKQPHRSHTWIANHVNGIVKAMPSDEVKTELLQSATT